MKSNWEAKAKISQEYEQERKRLEAEQRAAARELEVNKERNWRLLEEKGDIEMSISHIRILIKNINWIPDGESKVGSWVNLFKDLTRLEQKLSEQDMIVQVYRTALEKDCSAILKVRNNVINSI